MHYLSSKTEACKIVNEYKGRKQTFKAGLIHCLTTNQRCLKYLVQVVNNPLPNTYCSDSKLTAWKAASC